MSLSQTCLHDEHVKLEAKMVDFAGWRMPIQYTSIVSEHFAVRERVGIFDVSHMGQIFISGKDASSFLSYVTTWDVSKLSDGDCRYCHILDEKGRIIDDTIVYTLSSQEYMLVPNASMISKVFDWLNFNSSNFDVNVYDKSEDFFCLAVQGPESLRLLRQLFNLSVSPFNLIKSDNLIISGTGYTGEKGYEIMGPISECKRLWELFLGMGAMPIGLGARDTLRLEKGYLLSGTDFNGSQTTLESGYSWVIDWSHDFVGKEKLQEQKKSGFKSLSGILLEERGVLRPGLDVYLNGEKISVLTSGSMSPLLKRGIGLSYLDLPFGTSVEVQIRNKQLKGRVIRTPFL